MKKFLLLDGSLSPCRVALAAASGSTLDIRPSGRPLDGIFAAIEKIFKDGKCSWDDISTVVVCGGPGNMTGLRSVKMLVDVARSMGNCPPLSVFNGLELTAKWILESQMSGDFSVVAPISKQRCATVSAFGGILEEISYAETAARSGAETIFTMETGFAVAAKRSAPIVPVDFILGKIQPPSSTAEFILPRPRLGAFGLPNC